MIQASSLYLDLVDALNTETNGQFSYAMFNRYSVLAELAIMDWITGDLSGRVPPEPYTTMKNKDYLSPFIEKYAATAKGGIISRPENYYGFENMYLIGDYRTNTETPCGEDKEKYSEKYNTPIELLDGAQFYSRCNTYIEGLQPSFTRPIAKMIRKDFEFAPRDIGSVTLEYYRYPNFAKIVTTIDPTYNEEVVDENQSQNYEWDEKARPLLIWFIVDRFSNRTSNKSMKEMNLATPKTSHG